MVEPVKHFSLDELSALTDTPVRTVRYYIQQGLVDRPEGTKRGAYYTRGHLEQLLTIRRWTRAGVRLERIRELLATPDADELPPRRRRPGEISVRSHIQLCPGVELSIEPEEAGLTPEQVRALARGAAALVENIKEDSRK